MNKRQQIIQALKARLELIKKSTYLTDAGKHVYVWRSKSVASNEFPLINIYYAIDSDDVMGDKINGPGSVWDRALPVRLSIVLQNSDDVDEMEDVETDILKAIGIDETLGGLASAINVAGDSFTVNQEERRIVGAEMNITIIYRTNQYEH